MAGNLIERGVGSVLIGGAGVEVLNNGAPASGPGGGNPRSIIDIVGATSIVDSGTEITVTWPAPTAGAQGPDGLQGPVGPTGPTGSGGSASAAISGSGGGSVATGFTPRLAFQVSQETGFIAFGAGDAVGQAAKIRRDVNNLASTLSVGVFAAGGNITTFSSTTFAYGAGAPSITTGRMFVVGG